MENQNSEIVSKLDASISNVLDNRTVKGFVKAQLVAQAIADLKELLTPEYMKPIMALQGTRLGFRTDKDKNKDGTPGPGYPEAVVKNCLIEAVLMGLQPTGNQFNIIAGNTYPTKEGLGVVLNEFPGLKYDIVCGLPKINHDKTSAAVDATINWEIKGVKQTRVIPIPLKIDSYASVDSMIGKATRKARAWLLGAVTGIEITDGDVDDTTYSVVSSKPLKGREVIELERFKLLIADCKTLEELEALRESNPNYDNSLFETRKQQIIQPL